MSRLRRGGLGCRGLDFITKSKYLGRASALVLAGGHGRGCAGSTVGTGRARSGRRMTVATKTQGNAEARQGEVARRWWRVGVPVTRRDAVRLRDFVTACGPGGVPDANGAIPAGGGARMGGDARHRRGGGVRARDRAGEECGEAGQECWARRRRAGSGGARGGRGAGVGRGEEEAGLPERDHVLQAREDAREARQDQGVQRVGEPVRGGGRLGAGAQAGELVGQCGLME
jgi:hypothetical protein